MNTRIFGILIAGTVASVGVLTQGGLTAPSAAQNRQPEEKPPKPGLKVGEKSPEAMLARHDGKEVKLSSMVGKAPVVIIFYRGGWCPYCTKSMSAWAEKMDELKDAGASVVFITPDNPELADKTGVETKVGHVVLSDHKMEASKAFKLAFELDEKTKEKYRGYGVDLAKRNAAKTWELPHPGTFVVDTGGVIRYASVDTDYTKRAAPDEVIAAVKALKADK